MARLPVEASEPSPTPLPPCLLPSSLAHPPPPTLPPCSRMIFPKHKLWHGLSLPGEKPILAPLLPSGKSPRALALQGEVGGGPHLSSLNSFHQPCLGASCTQPLTMLCLPIIQPTVTERLLFCGSNHFPPSSDSPASPRSPSYPFLSAAHFPQAAGGIL